MVIHTREVMASLVLMGGEPDVAAADARDCICGAYRGHRCWGV